MRILLIIIGVLAGLYAVAGGVQLAGFLLGYSDPPFPRPAGIPRWALIPACCLPVLVGGLVSYVCLKKRPTKKAE